MKVSKPIFSHAELSLRLGLHCNLFLVSDSDFWFFTLGLTFWLSHLLGDSVKWKFCLFLCYDDTMIYSSTSRVCVFQGKIDSVATSLQLRSQIQVSVQLWACQTPGEGNFLFRVSADRLIRGRGIG